MSFNSLFISVVLGLSMAGGPAVAQSETPLPQVAGKPANVQYPFMAEVTGDDVYIRTGNSLNDYHSGKAGKGFKVTVVDEVLGWAKILPPEGSYSWIAKSYVNVTPGKSTGVVTGDSVRVWAGSDYREPIASPSLQIKLNAGEIVELMPNQPESSDYFKIKPPAGAHLWISAQFLKYVAGIQSQPVVVPPRPDSTVAAALAVPDANAFTKTSDIPPSTEQSRPIFNNVAGAVEETTDPNKLPIDKPAEPLAEKPVKPTPPSKESLYLKENYQFAAKIDAIAKKPLNEQDFTEIKQSLKAIIADAEAGRAADYSQILLDRIARHELAVAAIEQVQQQDKDLMQTREQIEKAHQAQLAKLPKEIDYLYTGTLKPSYVYSDKSGVKRYLLMDANGKIISYLTAATPEVAAKFDTLLNTKVGVKGTIANNAKSLVTLVNVTEVASFQQ